MNKYGIEHFHIKLIEECNNPEEREKYWIEKLDAYHNNYNATKGGEGKLLYNHDLILQKLKQGLNSIQIANEIGCCVDIVRDIAKANNIDLKKNSYVNQERIILQFSKEGIYIKEFSSITNAAK